MTFGGDNAGDRWSFIVDTDSYAGNFERELCAYVIGAAEEHGAHVARPYLKLFHMWCPVELAALSDTRVADSGDDGNRPSPCDLAPTPGWSNNGRGKTYKVRPNNKRYRYKYPAYNSVALFLRRRPTDEELTELVKRSMEFMTLQKVHPWEARPKTILGCRLMKESVQTEDFSVLYEAQNSAVRDEDPKEAVPGASPETAPMPNALYARLR